MLFEFLEENRREILALTEEKILKLAGDLSTSTELQKGLPVFFENLIVFLKQPLAENNKILTGAALHGKELLRLNYSLSHVVHAYGAICQAITEFAQRKKKNISTTDFNHLNLCLDIAIASAVSEYQFQSVQASSNREVEHLGFLVHELRNALSSASIAHEMIKLGLVGTGGSTANVLEENLTRMRHLIDRSLSDLRMRADPNINIEKYQLNVLIDQIVFTAQAEARKKNQMLKTDITSSIHLENDRQLMLSAIANLLQNALKYSKLNGHITIRAVPTHTHVVIEVQDECGGIEGNTLETLSKPFASSSFDKSGLGLGLTITQRAVKLLQGKIKLINEPGKGCSFQIEIPLKISPSTMHKTVFDGEDSVQPNSNKN
jgi:signal transduction histidine kinase